MSDTGFVLVSETDLPEHRLVSRRFRHQTTGLDLVHLLTDDPENMFAFVFRTPALDDYGTSHIIEHSVLCGSERFPVKDPFVLMMKGSVNTYLNAWTFPDKTVYPAATTVEKDFYNLMLVYGDAVFSPRLGREIFDQEAYRYQVGEKLDLVGVVYNEMRGVYSNPESIIGRWTYRSLFTDNTYRFESGGDPEVIPDLTYEGFLDYHRRFYHPSNARVMIYGNIPTERHLEFLQEKFLRNFKRIAVDSEIADPARWNESRRIVTTFPAGDDQVKEGQSTVLLNWLMGPARDAGAMVALEVLEELLTGNAGSPLRRALIESGLGQDLSPSSGLDTELKHMVYSIGLRGTEADRADKIESLVLGVLEKVAGGIDRSNLEGAIRRVEFRNREITRGGGPHSLRLLRMALRGWLHGAEPEATLAFDRWIGQVRRDASDGRLENLIGEGLLGNPHRTTLILSPEPGGQERLEKERAARVAKVYSSLSEQQLAGLKEANQRLEEFQQTPDTPESIGKIPSLSVDDLPRQVEVIPRKEEEYRGSRLLVHEMFTSGITYVDFSFALPQLSEEDLLLLPLLTRVVTGMGIPGASYDRVAQDLALKTGGFSSAVEAGVKPNGNATGYILFRVKALDPRVGEALDLTSRLITETDLSDTKRLSDLIHEMRNRQRSSILPGGSRYAALRAGANLSAGLRLEELWGGISQYLHLNDITDQTEALAGRLRDLRDRILTARPVVSLSGDQPTGARAALDAVWHRFTGPAVEASVYEPASQPRVNESLIVKTAVGYAAQGIPAAPFGTKENAAESVMAHMLSTGYLWGKIRTEGGAYGAGAHVSGFDRLITFSTYRDPNVDLSLAAFRSGLEVVQKADNAQITQSIIGSVGRDSRPLSPGEKAYVSAKRSLLGITDELRQKRREALFAVDPPSISQAAQRLIDRLVRTDCATVLLAGKPAVEKAAAADPLYADLAKNLVEVPM